MSHRVDEYLRISRTLVGAGVFPKPLRSQKSLNIEGISLNQSTFKYSSYCGLRAAALLLLLSIPLLGCRFEMRGTNQGPNLKGTSPVVRKDIVVPVEAQPPTRGKISAYYDTWTRVEAERKVDVAAESDGICATVVVDAGDTVSQGDVLATLEQDEALAALRQAEIQVKQDKTAYDVAQKQYEQGVGNKLDRDNALYTYQQSESTVKVRHIQLANKTITAPIDGTITTRSIQRGMLVSTNMNAFSIVDPTSFMLTIDPPEKELPRLDEGQIAAVTIDALPGEEFTARIRRINPAVDPQSGTVKAILDFEEEVRLRLRDSAFARVKLVMETYDKALLVPKEAIVEENARRFIFLVRPEEPDPKEEAEPESTGEPQLVARRIEILAGLEDSQFVQILGLLDETALVVVNGQNTLKDGSHVRVTNASDDIMKRADVTSAEALQAAKADPELGKGRSFGFGRSSK